MLVHLLKIVVKFLPIVSIYAIYYIPLMYLIDLIESVVVVVLLACPRTLFRRRICGRYLAHCLIH